MPVRVADLVVSDALLSEVKGPVLLEVAAGSQRSQLEHSFGAAQRPTCARDAKPVLQQMPACALDRARRKRQPSGQGAVIVEQLVIVDQVADAVMDDLLLVLVQLASGGPAAQVLGECARRTSL